MGATASPFGCAELQVELVEVRFVGQCSVARGGSLLVVAQSSVERNAQRGRAFGTSQHLADDQRVETVGVLLGAALGNDRSGLAEGSSDRASVRTSGCSSGWTSDCSPRCSPRKLMPGARHRRGAAQHPSAEARLSESEVAAGRSDQSTHGDKELKKNVHAPERRTRPAHLFQSFFSRPARGYRFADVRSRAVNQE